MYSIGELRKRFSISRSTILYYDSIGLLQPSGRSESGYRLYSDADMERMKKIMLYRDAGLSLKSIIEILDRNESQPQSILEGQLANINVKINELRCQQNIIIQILGLPGLVSKTRVITKNDWVAILRATGLDEMGMKRWHTEFEKRSPEAHQDFLESLGIDEKEIRNIRRLSVQEI